MKYTPKIVDGYYQSDSGYNYSFVFFSEIKCFDNAYRRLVLNYLKNTWLICFFYTIIYILTIYLGKRLMKNREKFDLRRPLIAWNITLAVFSALGSIRVWPEFIYVLRNYGVVHSICQNDSKSGVFGCWSLLFIYSKLAELSDTLFIILRKQPLQFLHWYHHATVLIYCWYSGNDQSASGRWFVVMNYTVHAFMYAYYAFRAMRFQIPKYISIIITFGQILQMVFGIYINLVAYFEKKNGFLCDVSYENIIVSFLMYASYFLLFCKFFYSNYLVKKIIKKCGNVEILMECKKSS
jgi:elongation of very long chain fatty acids protein 6